MAESTQIWPEAAQTLERQQPFALATVIDVRGSTPREIGAKMIVREDGQFGTIGGGCGEAEVFRKARLLLNEGHGARLAEVDLTGDLDQDQIGSCGGIMEVFINLWSPERDLPIARQLADSVAHSRPAALLTVLEPGNQLELAAGTKLFLDSSSESAQPALNGLAPAVLAQVKGCAREDSAALLEVDANGATTVLKRYDPSDQTKLFIDPVVGSQRLIIVGAGHIAQPLATLGKMLGFHVTIIDDRASFANRERFPDADEVIAKPFSVAINSLKLDRNCYVISVTRGHAFDEETLRAALKQPGCFIGMIGSRRRVRATLERLESDGFAPELLHEIHAPLGLDLGAETPEEIAVAIIAEIIRERRTGRRDDLTLGTKSGWLRRTT